MANTVSAFNFAMREAYQGQAVQMAATKGSPLLDLVPKSTNFSGASKPLPLQLGGGQGLAGKFTTAQANQSNVTGVKYQMEVGDYFGVIEYGEKVMALSRNDVGAFIRNKKTETDAFLEEYGDDVSRQLWGNGGGSKGVISDITGSTITLASQWDITSFEVGQKLVASTADGTSGTLRNSGAAITVTAINFSAGTFDFTGTITGLAANDYLFREGAWGANADGYVLFAGIQGHIPSTAPSSTAFYGVDRSVDDRLAGAIYTGNGGTLSGSTEQRLENAAAWHNGMYGGKVDHIVLHTMQWTALSRSLAQQGVRAIDMKNSTAHWGYKALEIVLPHGSTKIISDRMCPVNRSYGLDFSHMRLCSAEELIKPIVDDGNNMLRKVTSVDYEMRFRTYACLEVDKPSAHFTVALSSLV